MPPAASSPGTSGRSSATPSSSTRPPATSSSWPTRRRSTRRGAKSARAQGDAIFPTVTQVLTAEGGIRTDPASLTPPATPGRSDPTAVQRRHHRPARAGHPARQPRRHLRRRVDRGPAPAPERDPRAGHERRHVRLCPDHRRRDQWASSAWTTRRRQRRLRQPTVLRHRRLRVRPVLPARGRGVLVDHERAGDPGRRHDQGHLFRRRHRGRQPAAAVDPDQVQPAARPATINAQSVMLVGSGGNGIFGNANDVTYSLAGRLSYSDTASEHPDDQHGRPEPAERRVRAHPGRHRRRTSSRTWQGNALDGENTPNDDPNGVQQALPSGDGHPGRNFYLKFTIDTHAPSIVPGTFMLAPSSVTGESPLRHATTCRPSRARSPTSSRRRTRSQGDTVFLDVLEPGHRSVGPGRPDDDQRHRQLHGHGELAAARYALQRRARRSPRHGDDTGYGIARVRIVDQAGTPRTLSPTRSAVRSRGGGLPASSSTRRRRRSPRSRRHRARWSPRRR